MPLLCDVDDDVDRSSVKTVDRRRPSCSSDRGVKDCMFVKKSDSFIVGVLAQLGVAYA